MGVMTGVFTTKDTCDRCVAPAQVGFVKNKGELMFCSHHGTLYELRMVETGWEVVADDRAKLAGADTGR